MSKPHRPRYRTTNWPMYNRALERRGSVLILIDPATQWLAEPVGKMGRPAVFTDTAIQLCLSVKVLFKLPQRQAIGMVRGLLKLAGLDWPAPDYTTLCRRQKTLAVQIPYRRADGPLNLLVDSTGIKFLGDGEWQARNHGPSRRRQWRKVHLAMDPATSDIRAVEFTSSGEGDSPTLPALLDQIPEGEQIGSVTADGNAGSAKPAGRTVLPPVSDREQLALEAVRRALRLDPEQIQDVRSKRGIGVDACSRSDWRRAGSSGPQPKTARSH